MLLLCIKYLKSFGQNIANIQFTHFHVLVLSAFSDNEGSSRLGDTDPFLDPLPVSKNLIHSQKIK